MIKPTKEQNEMIQDLFEEMKEEIEDNGMSYQQEQMRSGKTIVFSETVGIFRTKALQFAKDKIIAKEWTGIEASAFSQAFGRKTHKLYWNK